VEKDPAHWALCSIPSERDTTVVNILQAQATRMVSAMAAAIAKFEPNAERKKWFLKVSTEYEDHRDDLIGVIELYLRGEGSAQRE
jgi:acyl-CoA reductase-like NAD-dependent aldehyde dehydrogenase